MSDQRPKGGKPPKKVQWWEPRRIANRRFRQDLRESFPPFSLIRMASITAVSVAAIAYVVNARVPNLQFDWVMATAKSVGGFSFCMVAMYALNLILPSVIAVKKELIVVAHGNSTSTFRYANPKFHIVTLVIHADGQRRMWITYGDRSYGYGVPPTVDLDDVQCVLGERLAICDYRRVLADAA